MLDYVSSSENDVEMFGEAAASIHTDLNDLHLLIATNKTAVLANSLTLNGQIRRVLRGLGGSQLVLLATWGLTFWLGGS